MILAVPALADDVGRDFVSVLRVKHAGKSESIDARRFHLKNALLRADSGRLHVALGELDDGIAAMRLVAVTRKRRRLLCIKYLFT